MRGELVGEWEEGDGRRGGRGGGRMRAARARYGMSGVDQRANIDTIDIRRHAHNERTSLKTSYFIGHSPTSLRKLSHSSISSIYPEKQSSCSAPKSKVRFLTRRISFLARTLSFLRKLSPCRLDKRAAYPAPQFRVPKLPTFPCRDRCFPQGLLICAS